MSATKETKPTPFSMELKTEIVTVLSMVLAENDIECGHDDTTEGRLGCPWCRSRLLLDIIKLDIG